jgi:hypothetical protein
MVVDLWRALAESAGRRQEGSSKRAEESKKMQKDTKIEGTNLMIC